ncbi:MAG: putative p-type ATPase superfamily [Streblomastix strix]|uniref:Putative p-type ATPase superfamily n=1 Tax=Streblomastix strix TaxID=222440 RepID=A0A5J4W704_9EUKA|nr:MAG: putative p-type ATPase superfamily [Streblomastix strix]
MGVDAGIALLDEEIELLGGKSESLNTLKRDRERKRLEKQQQQQKLELGKNEKVKQKLEKLEEIEDKNRSMNEMENEQTNTQEISSDDDLDNVISSRYESILHARYRNKYRSKNRSKYKKNIKTIQKNIKKSINKLQTGTLKLMNQIRNKTDEQLDQQLGEQQHNQSQQTLIHLGDASSAAPFSARTGSLKAVIDVIRYGRVTKMNIQRLFKITALYSLINAYYLSFLTLVEARKSERQLTLWDMTLRLFMYSRRMVQPLKRLSSVRPPNSIFSLYQMLSLIGQSVVQLAVLGYACNLAIKADPHHFEVLTARHAIIKELQEKIEQAKLTKDPKLKEYIDEWSQLSAKLKFQPTLVNSVVFLILFMQSFSIQSTFYVGRPFMEGFFDRKILIVSLLSGIFVVIFFALEIVPPINRLLDFTPFPTKKLKLQIIALLAVSLLIPVLWEQYLKKKFLRKKKRKTGLKSDQSDKK